MRKLRITANYVKHIYILKYIFIVLKNQQKKTILYILALLFLIYKKNKKRETI